MGWSSGSELMGEIIGGLKAAKMDPVQRRKAYKVLIPAFENYDCDTLEECRGRDPAFDACLPVYDD